MLFLVYDYSEDRVVVDDNVITSRGPGTTFLFALTIVEHLTDVKVLPVSLIYMHILNSFFIVKTANALKDEMLTCSVL